MGKKNDKFEYAGKIASEQAAQHLEQLAAGIRAGHMTLGAGDQRTAFTPGDVLKMEIVAEGEGREGTIAVEMSWKPTGKAAMPELEILAEEPEEAQEGQEVEAGESDDGSPKGSRGKRSK